MRNFYDPSTLLFIMAGAHLLGGIQAGQQAEAEARSERDFINLEIIQERKASQREIRDLDEEKRRSLARTRAVLAAQGDLTDVNALSFLAGERTEFDIRRRRLLDDTEARVISLQTRGKNVLAAGEAERNRLIFGGIAGAAGSASRATLLRKPVRTAPRGEGPGSRA